MSKKETKLGWIYRVVIPKVTSLGAAVVVIGALFKIQHLPGAGFMLGIGLITESIIFALGVFQPSAPAEAHYEWERAYPELADDSMEALPKPKKNDDSAKKGIAATAQIDQFLSEANLNADTFKSFGSGMKKLHESVNQMKDMSGVATASEGYTQSLSSATKSMGDLNKAYGETLGAMSSMAAATKDAKEYHSQVQVITKNLGALNAVYEMELKDANSHLKAMNKFYSNLTVAMESMSEASKESKVFKDQMTSLTSNLTQMNKVYGNMLSAMKG
jgi:gliding motility-associated protein GldL